MFDFCGSKCKKHLLSFLAASFVALSGVTAAGYIANPAQAEAKMVSPEQERKWAENARKEDQSKYEMTQAEPGSPLRRIQDELIKYNSDRLNYNDGKHDRWLEPVWLATKGMDGTAWSKGGYVLIANDTVQQATYDGTFTERDIYGSSMVAKTLAHEFAHFANNDIRKGNTLTSEKTLACEWEADRDSLEFLSNVPEFSIGTRFSRDAHLDGLGLNLVTGEKTHPSDKERSQMVMDTIKKWSNGRVQINRDCQMIYDGKLFNGTGYADGDLVYERDRKERTVYLAGQIADCIRRGVWKRENLGGGNETSFYKDGDSHKSVLAVFNDSSLMGTPVKILGNFDFDFSKKKADRTAGEQAEVDVYNAILHLSLQ